MPRGLLVLASILIAVPAEQSMAASPGISNLDPGAGPERTLVSVSGTDLQGGTVHWDGAALPSPLGSGSFFSVPANAAPGDHVVTVTTPNGTSPPATFTVTPEIPPGSPRIDRVSAFGPKFEAGGVKGVLIVQGPNIDVGATVLIDGQVVASGAAQALRNDLFGIDPEALGYYVPHYLALYAVLPLSPAGDDVDITVTNSDGVASAEFRYTLPTALTSLDSDGDGLTDAWEMANNSNPLRPDMFVQVDRMAVLTHYLSGSGQNSPFDRVEEAFARAPIINPGFDPGVAVHFDAGNLVNTSGYFALSNGEVDGTAAQQLSVKMLHDYKDTSFPVARAATHHYGIWARRAADGGTGRSDGACSNVPRHPGNDFYVTLGAFDTTGAPSLKAQTEILMHELGHNLALYHSGETDEEDNWYNPQHWSVMSYSWVLRTARPNSLRWRGTCLPMYYGLETTAISDKQVISEVPFTSFAEGLAAPRMESAANEDEGSCGVPFDWNNTGSIESGTHHIQMNNDLDPFDTVAGDFSDWRNLDFGGPEHGGCVN